MVLMGKGMARYESQVAQARAENKVGSGPLGIKGWKKCSKAELKHLWERRLITTDRATRLGVKLPVYGNEYEAVEVIVTTIDGKTVKAQAMKRKSLLTPAERQKIKLVQCLDKLKDEKREQIKKEQVKKIAQSYLYIAPRPKGLGK